MLRNIKDIIYILKNSNLIVRATFIALVILVLGYIKATCFADNFKSWELVDLQNAIANNLITSGITEEQAKNSIDAKEEQLKTIVNYLNEYHYTYLAWRNNKELDILCTNVEDHWYLYRNFPMINGGSNVSSINYNITYSNNSLNISQLSNNSSAGSYNHNANIYYTGNKIYSGYNNNTIIRNGGDYSPSTLFDKNVYLGKYFEINLNTNNNTEYFNIVTDTGNDIEDIPVLNSYNFGTLEDNTYIYYIHDLLGFWYWTGNSWTYKTIYNRNKDMVLLKNNEYMNYSYFNNYESANLMINNLYQYKNVIYHYQITNSEFNSVDAYFLIGDDTTLITNNTIDTTNFNNDYLSQFEGLDNIINNNDNTQNIINAIESGDKLVIDALTSTTLESGEEPTIENLPEIEIEDISEDFFTWLLSEFLIVLNNDNNTYLEIPIYNNSYRIYSNEFILNIEPLRTFINIGWWFICGVPFLKFIRRMIEKLKGGNIPLSDEKSDLLGNIL